MNVTELDDVADELFGFQWRTDPEFQRALDEARAKFERAVTRVCHYGNCSVDVDPLDNKVIGGAGPVLCPCDNLPGWRSAYLEGAPRPAAPVKARGRHGSRVQRSRRRHALPDMGELGDWLPAQPR